MSVAIRRAAAVFVACTLCCAAAISLVAPRGHVRSTDKNGDGRPDIWQTYDRQGHLSEVAIDTNYDGRVDRREFYERGGLVRLESDRDFNDRVDLVQDFDPLTRQPIRTIADVDSDGVADLLVLFRNGQVVLSKWAQRPATAALAVRASASTELAPLVDPFLGDLSFRERRVPEPIRGGVVLSASTALTVPQQAASLPNEASAALETDTPLPACDVAPSSSPRAPPPSHLLA